ncbi:MAG: hypothetical protein FWG98_11525 [Candidatus Cloacimonetes bacterium]|nr:hypothetical protein [Candidatus Cloacimonadota bacterium]
MVNKKLVLMILMLSFMMLCMSTSNDFRQTENDLRYPVWIDYFDDLTIAQFSERIADNPQTEINSVTRKSASLAMLMSAAVPGSGQYYIGKNTRATVFLTADIFSFFALYRFSKEKNNLIDHYQMYAYSHADLRKGASDDIYSLAHRYTSSDEYNRMVILYARNFLLANRITQEEYDEYVERNIIGHEDSWTWQTDFHYNEYRDIRRDKQNYEIYENFAVGALIVNRLISVIDAAIQTNRVNRISHVYAVPIDNGRGITLLYEHKF